MKTVRSHGGESTGSLSDLRREGGIRLEYTSTDNPEDTRVAERAVAIVVQAMTSRIQAKGLCRVDVPGRLREKLSHWAADVPNRSVTPDKPGKKSPDEIFLSPSA